MTSCMGAAELRLLERVIRSGKLWRKEGTFVSEFERQFARHMGAKYALAVNSGTSALEAAVVAVGVGPGDEVICTPYSFIASSTCVLRANAVPVFADIDPRTLCLDPEDVARKITKRTKAIIVVHIYGRPAHMDELLRLARRYRLFVIEDCCQAYDALYKGKKVGTLGDIGVFSLQQAKQITCGEGGILITDNEDCYRRASMYANIGMIWDWPPPEEGAAHFAVGGNYRMGELQGAVALAQLRKLDRFNRKRRGFAAAIEAGLSGLEGIGLPYVYEGTEPNYYFYPLRYKERDLGISKSQFLAECRGKLPENLHGLFFGDAIYNSYTQPVYREMSRRSLCPIGCPKYKGRIKYEKGLCPKLEGFLENPDLIAIRLHQSGTLRDIKRVVNAMRAVVRKHSREQTYRRA